MALTEKQRTVVQTDALDVLCVAGAGAGKTATLIERILRLLQEGTKASEILCLTFTRRAAQEMINRLLTQVDIDDLAGMRIGTFHAIAFQILREHGDKLGYRPDEFTIIDAIDSLALLQVAARDLGILIGDRFKNGWTMKRCVDCLERHYRGQVGEDVLVARYRKRLFSFNALDFGSMLQEIRRLFTQCPEILARLRAEIKHVIVDELQDSDPVQFDLHEWFAGHAKFVGVGDPRQTIYSWRGASPSLMHDKHPRALTIYLTECFRCAPAIVAVANSVAQHIGDYPPLECMRTRQPGTARIAHGRSSDVVDQLIDASRRGYAWEDMAVIARTHDEFERIEEVASKKGVPFHHVRPINKSGSDTRWQVAIGALRLIVNPRDDLAMLRTAGRWLTTTQLGEVEREAQAKGNVPLLSIAAGIGSPYKELQELAVTDARDRTLMEIEFGETLRAMLGIHVGSPLLSLTIRDLLETISLSSEQDDASPMGKVTLTTAHASKGLEWPFVLVMNLQENYFPIRQSLSKPAKVMEERRLFYVAVTRARDELVLHVRRPSDQRPPFDPQSRFVDELTDLFASPVLSSCST